MTERLLCLTIDGQEIECPVGYTIYEAATEAGIHIPTFCHHEKLVPVGACRMCLVEIEGLPALQTSCTTPVREGMVVKVHTSPAAVKARRANIEFLLTNHPLDCPVCDKGGECPLQDQALLDGPGQSRYIEDKRHKAKRHPLSPFIVVDQERCVLCWRCIRFLDEWADDHELDLFGRGAKTRLDTFPGRPLRSKWQGNTIDICPVGALTSRIFRFKARVWELSNTQSICPLCSAGCNIVLGVKNNRLRRVVPRENKMVNDAWLCDRGRFDHAALGHPEEGGARRLETPLIRREGALQPATWEEALDLIAGRLRQIIDRDGAQAIGGLGSTRVTNEANYLFQRFMRGVVGTNNVDHPRRMPLEARPLPSLPQLERQGCILLLGTDPSTAVPMVELWIKKAVLRHGASVVIAHPQQIELSRYAQPWLAYRPGSEAALLNGLAALLLDSQGERRATRLTNLEELRSWLKAYTPEQVEKMTGVAAADLRQAAQTLSLAAVPAAILYGPDWLHADARANLAAVNNLALLLGDAEAGFVAEDNNTLGALEMGVVPDRYPGNQPFADNKVRSRLASLWKGRLSPLAGIDLAGMLAAAGEGKLQALWVMGNDPARDVPEAGSALASIPFLVVQDLFLSETAALAEVVLPAASFAEADGTFTNLTGRWQAIHAALRPPGTARADWQIIVELARRMVDSKQQRAWSFSNAGEILDEIARTAPAYRSLESATLAEQGWQPPAAGAAAERTRRRAFVIGTSSARGEAAG